MVYLISPQSSGRTLEWILSSRLKESQYRIHSCQALIASLKCSTIYLLKQLILKLTEITKSSNTNQAIFEIRARPQLIHWYEMVYLNILQILDVHVFRIAKLKILTGFFLDFLLDTLLPHLHLDTLLPHPLQLPLFQTERLGGLVILSVAWTEHHLVSLGRHLQSGSFLSPLSDVAKSYLLKSCKEYSWHQWLWSWRLAVATLKNAAEISLASACLLKLKCPPFLLSLLELARVPSSSLLQSLHI